MNELHRAIGQLIAGQEARGVQMDRMEKTMIGVHNDIADIRKEHARTREMVIRNSTAGQVIAWALGLGLAVWGAVKGFWAIENK